VILSEKRSKLLEGGTDLRQQLRDEISLDLLKRFSKAQSERSYPDTDAKRGVWHYPAGQSEDCGFPVVRLGGLIDLSRGG